MQRSQGGITLIETLAVVAIVAVLSALVLPGMLEGAPGARADAVRAELEGAVARARGLAARSGVAQRVELVAAGAGRVRVDVGPKGRDAVWSVVLESAAMGGLDDAVEVGPRAAPDGVEDDGRARLVLATVAPDGSVHAAGDEVAVRIETARGVETYGASVRAWSGRVELVREVPL